MQRAAEALPKARTKKLWNCVTQRSLSTLHSHESQERQTGFDGVVGGEGVVGEVLVVRVNTKRKR